MIDFVWNCAQVVFLFFLFIYGSYFVNELTSTWGLSEDIKAKIKDDIRTEYTSR